SPYSTFSFRFFFQAEDGIRDRNVTGVQTCALPISMCARRRRRPESSSANTSSRTRIGWSSGWPESARSRFQPASCSASASDQLRSEERRVGKEGRSRGQRYQTSNKRQTEHDGVVRT